MPIDEASITRDWLSEMVGVPVSDLAVSVMEGGVASDVLRIYDVRYARPAGDAPTSFVVKVAAASNERQALALACGLYRKELNFYRLLAAQTPIRSPRVYACVDDGNASPQRFAILMEDLSVGSRVFDQVEDPPNVQDARAIALDAARLHAHFWESEATRLPWLGRPDGRYFFPIDPLCRASRASFPVLLSLWADLYGEGLFDGGGLDESRQLCELLCGPSCEVILDRIYDVLSSRPKTLLHGDMRADNVFRPDDAVPGSSPLTFIDWQLAHVGPPGPDLTEAFISSVEPDVRRQDLTILREYHDALVGLNPAATAYRYEMLVEDYSLGYCFWLTTLISAGAATLPSFRHPRGARMKRLWEKMLARALVAVTDLECLGRVESILQQT